MSSHSAALLSSRSLALDAAPILEALKGANVAFESSSGRYYAKTGPWGGVALTPFFAFVNASPSFSSSSPWSELEKKGKAASVLALVVTALLLFATVVKLCNSIEAAVAAQCYFLFATTTLPILSQGAWIHTPMLLLHGVAFWLLSSKQQPFVSGLVFGLSIVVRPLGILTGPALLFNASVQGWKRQALGIILGSATAAAPFVVFSVIEGLGSTYGKELEFSLQGVLHPLAYRNILGEFFSPNAGVAIFLPMMLIPLIVSVARGITSNEMILALPFLLFSWLGCWWWAGLSAGGVGRLLSDCLIAHSLLFALIYTRGRRPSRAFFGAVMVIALALNLRSRALYAAPLPLRNEVPLLKPRDNRIDDVYDARWKNDWYTSSFFTTLPPSLTSPAPTSPNAGSEGG